MIPLKWSTPFLAHYKANLIPYPMLKITILLFRNGFFPVCWFLAADESYSKQTKCITFVRKEGLFYPQVLAQWQVVLLEVKKIFISFNMWKQYSSLISWILALYAFLCKKLNVTSTKISKCASLTMVLKLISHVEIIYLRSLVRNPTFLGTE